MHRKTTMASSLCTCLLPFLTLWRTCLSWTHLGAGSEGVKFREAERRMELAGQLGEMLHGGTILQLHRVLTSAENQLCWPTREEIFNVTTKKDSNQIS